MISNKVRFQIILSALILITLWVNVSANKIEPPNSPAIENQIFLPQQSLSNEDITGISGEKDQFGVSMAVDNGVVVIGADKAKGFGVVYIYEYDGAEWRFVQTIESNEPTYGDYFGSSVDIKGDRLVVGAYHDSVDNVFGAVYLFEKTIDGWQQSQKIVSEEPQYESHFGVSVELFADWLFIGSSGDSVDGLGEVGRVHVYKQIDENFTLVEKLQQPIPYYGSAFGANTYISNDFLFIGATAIEHGKVYVFSLENNQWTYKQTLEPQFPIRGSMFGVSMSQANNTLAIGSPSGVGGVYLFELVAGSWLYDQEIIASDRSMNSWFGNSVKLVGDELIVGSYRDNDPSVDSGSVYIFNKVSNLWIENEKLYPMQLYDSGQFGTQVESYDDFLLVSGYRQNDVAYRSGLVTNFKKQDESWSLPTALPMDPGASFRRLGYAISAYEGEIAAIALPNSHNPLIKIYNYNYVGSDWVQQPKVNTVSANNANNFDFKIAHNSNFLVYGASVDRVDDNYSAGAVYIYRKENGGWVFDEQITSPLIDDRYFGKSLDIDDNRLVIASNKAVFVYEYQGGWQYSDTLWNISNVNSTYGEQVAVQGDRIMVNGRKYENAQLGNEHLFEYELINGHWQEVATINDAAITDPNEQFAKSFFWQNNKLVLVSSPKLGANSFYGAIHYYEQEFGQWQHKQTILPESLGENYEFGLSVVFNADYLFVGSPKGTTEGKVYGKVNVYHFSNNQWNYISDIYRSNNYYFQGFGTSLALLNQQLIVSTPRDNEQGNDAGSIEVIDISEIDIIFKNGF